MTDTFTVDELAAYPGVASSPDSVALVAGLINELVAETLEEHGITTPAKPARVKKLALEAAARPLINPEGATTRSIQIDDYKETVVLPDGSVVKAGTGIGFTPDEMGRLVDAITGQTTQRTPIRLGVPGVTTCDLNGVAVQSGWL